jgi:hypothetical protein
VREEREQRLSKVENATDHRMDQTLAFCSSLGYAKDTTGMVELKALGPSTAKATEIKLQVQ